MVVVIDNEPVVLDGAEVIRQRFGESSTDSGTRVLREEKVQRILTDVRMDESKARD
jgi:hypothetical protein